MDGCEDPGSRRYLRTLARGLRIEHLGLAFLWSCVLLTFRSSVILCSCIDTFAFAALVVMVGLAFQSIVMLTLAALSARQPGVFARFPAWLFVSVALTGLVLLSLVGHIGPDGSRAASIGGSGCAGFGYGYLYNRWSQAYGRMHPTRSSFYLPLVLLLTLGLFFTVAALSEAFQIQATLLMLPLPLLSLWCLRACSREDSAQDCETADDAAYLGAFRSLWRLLFGAVVLAFMFGFAWQLAVEAVGSVNAANRIPLTVSLAAGSAYAALVVFGRRKIDLSMVYRVTVPVFMVAFALLPLLWDQSPIVLYSALSAGFSVFEVVVWCMVSEAAYDNRVAGFVVGGIVRGVMLLFQLVGVLLGYLYAILPDRPPLLIVVVSTVALYFVVMWLLVATRRKAPAEARGPDARAAATADARASAASPAPAAPTGDALGERCERIAKHYRLTRREGEVLPYLAQGRSAKVVAEALFVSENTVRSHISRILEKTDLHSKQELIDLAEAFDKHC